MAPTRHVTATTRIWIVGPMGSGKSAVGREVARRLGWPLVDNDEQLRARHGVEGPDLAAAGPALLHRLESEQLHRALGLAPPFVAGVAASVADRGADLDLLAWSGLVVYLRATTTTLVRRVSSSDSPRPWVGQDPAQFFERTHGDRDLAYRSVAHLVLDVDDRDPGDLADQIVDALLASVVRT